MAKLKLSPDLSIGLLELQRLQDFAVDSNKDFLSKLSKNFGFIKNLQNNAKVTVDTYNSSVNYRNIIISSVFAVSSDFNFIKTDRNYTLPIYDGISWLRCSHIQNVTEKGLISVNEYGEITGVDTEFLNIFKSYSETPTTICFTNSVNNTLEYPVLQILDNQNAVLQGNFVAEQNLEFAIVGEFTPGVEVLNDKKFPFRFDSCLFEVIEESDFNVKPEYEEGKHFYLCRIISTDSGQNITVQDKRVDFFNFENNITHFSKSQFAKIISVKYNTAKLLLDENIVTLYHGVKCSTFTISQNNKSITLLDVLADKYKKYNIETGSLVGYRLYLKNGNYYEVSSYQISALNIVLNFDYLNIDDFSEDGGLTLFYHELFLSPPYDAIEYNFIQDTDNSNSNLEKSFLFNINTPECKCSININDKVLYFRLRYRFVKNYKFSEWFLHDSDNENGYLTEESFNDLGLLKPFENQIRQKFESSTLNGFLKLTLSKNSFFYDRKSIKKNNEGFSEVFFTQNQQVLDLYPGVSKMYQFFGTQNSFASNFDKIYINLLKDENTQDGAEFNIVINNSSISESKTLSVVFGYVSESNAGTVLKVISSRDIKHSMNIDGGIKMTFIYSGNKWFLSSQNYEIPKKGEIINFHGTETELSECFSNSGLGNVKGWLGYALCDGRNNTPDLRDRFVMGLSSETVIGQTGGSNLLELTIENIPSHSHLFRGEFKSVGKNSGVGESVIGNNIDWSKPISDTNEALKGTTSSKGGDTSGKTTPIDNKPKYIVLAYVKRLY